jgi:hypothetical protein
MYKNNSKISKADFFLMCTVSSEDMLNRPLKFPLDFRILRHGALRTKLGRLVERACPQSPWELVVRALQAGQ